MAIKHISKINENVDNDRSKKQTHPLHYNSVQRAVSKFQTKKYKQQLVHI